MPSSGVRPFLSTAGWLFGKGLHRSPGSVVHRKGAPSRFIPARTGPNAKLATVVAAANDPETVSSIGKSASFAARIWDPASGGVRVVESMTVSEVGRLAPDELIEVRRPTSFPGKKSFSGKLPVPTIAHRTRSVWFESLNELYHYRDILISDDVVQLSTQPFEITWVFSQGIRSHIPDCLLQTGDGRRVLIDVTTREKVADPRNLAILRLTSATARAAGWSYEVRTEMPAQRQRNISFVLAHRPAAQEQLDDWLARLARVRLPQTTYALARDLHDDGLPAPVWGLIALGRLAVDLSRPLRPDTVVSETPMAEVRDWMVTL